MSIVRIVIEWELVVLVAALVVFLIAGMVILIWGERR